MKLKTLRGALAVACVLASLEARAEKVDFAEKIAPILEKNCIGCHGAEKAKAKLRLHTKEDAFKGGKSGPAFVPGKLDESPVYGRISLPSDSDDIMPPEDEGSLSKDEIALIAAWIEAGADWPAGVSVGKVEAKVVEKPPVDPLDPAVYSKLREAGILALPVAQNVPWVFASFRSLGDKASDEVVAQIAGVEQLSDLNLAGSAITDGGLAHLAGLKHLVRLHLERTQVGDAGLAHLGKLTKLEYLNLYGTKVTDAGLPHLAGLTSLKKLYLWQTGVTEEGVAKLVEAIPGLYVNTGYKEPPKEEPPKEEPKPEEPEAPAAEGDAVALVKASSEGWSYAPTKSLEGNAWAKAEFDAKAWKTGKAPIGYGEALLAERKGTTFDLTGQDVAFRREIELTEEQASKAASFRLRVASDNSAIVWINGQEVDKDTDNHEATYWNRDVKLASSVFQAGKNVIAVLVNNTAGSSDLVFDLELLVTLPPAEKKDAEAEVKADDAGAKKKDGKKKAAKEKKRV